MRKKIHNVALVTQIVNDATITVNNFLVSKAISHRHHQLNYMAWARTDISMRAIETLSRLGLALEHLLATSAVEGTPTAVPDIVLSSAITRCQLVFEKTIHTLIDGHVVMVELSERGDLNDSSEPGMVHESISHGIRKAQEHHWNHHRDHSVKPMLSRFRNAIKCVVDGKYLDAIRDVTYAVYLTELDLDPESLQETNNRSNLTGNIASYVGD